MLYPNNIPGIVIILLIILYVLYVLFFKNNKKVLDDKHVHSNNNYPDMKFIFDNRKIIQDEFLLNVKNSGNWSNWMEYDKVSNTPIFSKMTTRQIINRMFENKCF